jgi:hypothetical protein
MSVAVAVNLKGVDCGIVKFPLLVTTGVLFVVFVTVSPRPLPFRNARISLMLPPWKYASELLWLFSDPHIPA